MLKRTKGFVLLLLLVATGLASQVASNTLTNKERRLAINQLKESRDAYLKSIKGLSAAQLAFKPGEGQWSVQDCMIHIALTEDGLWNMVQNTLKEPANANLREEIQVSDEDILNMMHNREQKIKTSANFEPASSRWSSAEDALQFFKEQRQKNIKHIKTSTEDFRSHVSKMPFGALDAYQLVLLIAGHTARHTQQINEIKAHPGFPKE